MRPLLLASLAFPSLLATACTVADDDDSVVADDDDAVGDDDDAPASYAFDSRFADESSVSYGGQVFRHVLMSEMKDWLGEVTGRIDTGAYVPSVGGVQAGLEFYYEFDGTDPGVSGLPHGINTTPAPLQETYGDFPSLKNLSGKIAGADADGQHADWSTELVGWTLPDGSTPSPDGLVRHWFAQIDAAAVDRANGIVPTDPEGHAIGSVFLTADGQDLQQLLQKFLGVAVAYSQGADDYLDDDFDGKGLLADHAVAEDGEAYTALEHAWDEGFGYFGASRWYGDYTDADIAAGVTLDSNPDGAIDLLSELNQGHAVNAGKRDAGAVEPTDFTGQAWTAFLAGRHLLATADGALESAQLDALRGHRDQALAAWEAAIGATVVHYINDVLTDMATLEATPADYSFADHSKHWSELKGFALGFQFSPHSALSDAGFVQLHALLGQAPALADDDLGAYRSDLRAARILIGDAFDFDPENLGDADGNGGW